MTNILTREELSQALDRFTDRRIEASSLATWAFDQFYAAEAAQLAYEAGFEALIAEVLDELMWSDSPPFGLSVEDAQRLQERLDRSVLDKC